MNFLTTKKMAPALAARIEASVRGKRGRGRPPSRSTRDRVSSLGRLGLALAVAGLVVFVIAARREDRRTLEGVRSVLLGTVHDARASLTPEDMTVVARASDWLTRSSGGYEGDFVAPELQAAGALAARMSRPTLYVRGELDSFGSPSAIAAAATSSQKDPLAVCLVEPPAGRTEKALFERVREAYSRGADAHAPNVRRLHDVIAGLPLLEASWSDGVRAAGEAEDIDRARRELQRAPIEGAKRAAKAELLLFAFDEPGAPGGTTELDGERPHDVRVVLVDLAAGKMLLRQRRRVDPSWVSASKKAEYSAALDGCKLAAEVYDSVSGAAPEAARAKR
jgi:hypothetical protein